MYNKLILAALLLFGASNLADSSASGDDSYLVSFGNGAGEFVGRSRREVVDYEIKQLEEEGRVKRDVEESSKDNGKPSVPTKKPIDPINKSSNNNSSESVQTTQTTPVVSSTTATTSTTSTVLNGTVPTASTTASSTTTESDDELNREFPNYPVIRNGSDDGFRMQNESHTYYDTSTIADGMKFWVDMSHPAAEVHEMLSNAHRRAATLKLHFDFPFYGHLVDNATIATGGFVYLGEQAHKWLAATQYAAPLMANFDSSLSENASIRYLSTLNQFTVEWGQIHLKDTPEKGPFSFQLSMYKNGTIAFVYKTLPIPIQNISDQSHPVKVGISDAYVRDKNILFVKQKTIYEYHRVELKNREIKNGTAIIFTALPTCLSFLTCKDCANHNSTFECSWCPTANRCSDGTDRYRHDWIVKECDQYNTTNADTCGVPGKSSYNVDSSTTAKSSTPIHSRTSRIDDVEKSHITQGENENGMSAGGVVSILFLVMMVVGVVGWLFYAYIFPHSTSGQLLIRYRPSQWAFRRGEARYTAASIHM